MASASGETLQHEATLTDRSDHDEDRPAKRSRALYVSHFLSTWNSRGFEFGAVLFLASIYPGTLMPMSIYALIRAASAIVCSPWIGRYIDDNERLKVIRLSIVGQRLPVVLSCFGFLFLLTGAEGPWASTIDKSVFAGLVILACIEKLSSVMNTVVVERDWVVVIADNQEDVLTEMNSQMRRIDLFCKLVSPLFVALLDGYSSRAAVRATLTINATVLGAEYLLVAWVYHRTPALCNRSIIPAQAHHLQEIHPAEIDDSEVLSQRSSPTPEDSLRCDMAQRGASTGANKLSTAQAIKNYVKNDAFLPSLSLSILYLTVLSFSGQMTTFLLAVPAPKLGSAGVGVLRTVSTLFELSSTFLASRIMTHIGPVRAGIWFLSWQALCLTIGVTFLWTYAPASSGEQSALLMRDASSGTTSQPAAIIIIFISMVILSRVGLWSFDLVAQLHIQASIDSSQRGSFSSIEASLQNFFELCTFASTIVWSKPEQFRYPAAVSLCACYVASMCYAKFVRHRRGHLMHLPHCLDVLKEGRGMRYAVVAENEDDHE